jgi:hypothetical protein
LAKVCVDEGKWSTWKTLDKEQRKTLDIPNKNNSLTLNALVYLITKVLEGIVDHHSEVGRGERGLTEFLSYGKPEGQSDHQVFSPLFVSLRPFEPKLHYFTLFYQV